MKSLWNDAEAASYGDDLGLRVYTSRLLGRDHTLVLHGGGNTSVKITEKNIFGEDEEILYVKGSGWDLETIDRPGFAPVKLQHLIRLAELPSLSDPDMVTQLKANMTNPGAPTPSVEAILHATLPYKFVDHTHADAIVTITNTKDGEARIRQIYGDSVVIIPYIMPGFDLARDCAKRFAKEAGPQTKGMVLLNHGIFSFADTARESYERMIELVGMAEAYLQKQNAWDLQHEPPVVSVEPQREVLASMRQQLSKVVGAPMILSVARRANCDAFAHHPQVASISQQGPATPDHVIRTKQKPLLGRDIAGYAQRYQQYFDTHAPRARDKKTILDKAPRVILDKELGMLAAARSAKDAAIIKDIYSHTVDIILRAEKLGGYRALSDQDIFDMEYWDLEQAKLKGGGKAPMFTGEVALVTGAASGIGKAAVEAMLARGAAVIALDVSAGVADLFKRADYYGVVCDVSDEDQVKNAIELGVRRFGGIDMLVLNAGLFPGGCRVDKMDLALWHKVMAVNLDANVTFLRECYPLLKLSPNRGRVVVIGSKNVPAPGPGAAAYSASKAALTQLMRVTALEWGGDGIRLNMLHPDAVFDTGIWSEDILAARAKHYGLSVDEYKTKNVLKTTISSRDVAELAAEMCGPLFAKTTAAQLPIDGGNDRVI
ncbi:MAG: bifunctional aldolase/short-chain dehydrogenase [Gammaproteobacteria bacterium]|nr:bifunctional aldolase/short-chain dehydrogenase [Gammaproteobacteria bacterium]